MEANFTIRHATQADIPAIKKLADVVFRATYAPIISPEQMEYMLEWMYSEKSLIDQITLPGKAFFVASEGDRPIGYVTVERDGNTPDGLPLFHLQKLYLLPTEQGKGYGKKMFHFLVDYLKSICPGQFRIELNVNRHNKAVGFYEAIGMYRSREGDFPIGDGFYMRDYIYAYDVDNR